MDGGQPSAQASGRGERGPIAGTTKGPPRASLAGGPVRVIAKLGAAPAATDRPSSQDQTRLPRAAEAAVRSCRCVRHTGATAAPPFLADAAGRVLGTRAMRSPSEWDDACGVAGGNPRRGRPTWVSRPPRPTCARVDLPPLSGRSLTRVGRATRQHDGEIKRWGVRTAPAPCGAPETRCNARGPGPSSLEMLERPPHPPETNVEPPAATWRHRGGSLDQPNNRSASRWTANSSIASPSMIARVCRWSSACACARRRRDRTDRHAPEHVTASRRARGGSGAWQTEHVRRVEVGNPTTSVSLSSWAAQRAQQGPSS